MKFKITLFRHSISLTQKQEARVKEANILLNGKPRRGCFSKERKWNSRVPLLIVDQLVSYSPNKKIKPQKLATISLQYQCSVRVPLTQSFRITRHKDLIDQSNITLVPTKFGMKRAWCKNCLLSQYSSSFPITLWALVTFFVKKGRKIIKNVK